MIRRIARYLVAPLASAGLLYAVLALQTAPRQAVTIFVSFPLEWPVLISGLLLMPAAARWKTPVLAGVTCFLVGLLVLKCADIAMITALNWPFSPVVDMFLVGAGLNVLAGSIGTLATALVLAAATALVAALLFATFKALLCLARLRPSQMGQRWASGVCAIAAGLLAADLARSDRAWALGVEPPGTALNTGIVIGHLDRAATALIEVAKFRAEALQDPYADSAGLFDLIGDRDVIILYVESYGRSSFDNPLYADTHVPTLRQAEAQLAEAGFAMQSGWLNSPTAGGQSWLAHGTLATGLRTTDQGRYGAMLTSGRNSLFHLAQKSGFRTAAVMPAITLAWPEALRMGFDTILAADDLGYAGRPFNWVTMPDQYTLSAYGALLPDDPRPDFLQIALISSHAPWVPIPEMIGWDEIGDGSAFDRWADAGDPPSVVWRDRDRVRDQYRRAVDYALQAATEYAARREDLPLFVILGDHQPAGFVAGIDSHDVAAHLIGPPDLVAQAASWGWRDGLVPDADTPVWPMEAFRDAFIRAYTSPQLACGPSLPGQALHSNDSLCPG